MSAFNYTEAKQKLPSSPDLCFDPVTCSMALQQLALKKRESSQKKREWVQMLGYVMQKEPAEAVPLKSLVAAVLTKWIIK